MVCDKVRIRFRKTGDLRLVSHHDLMRCWERMLRRAELPFHSTAGFNPKPRLVFALSLALGIVGCEEVAELELDAEVPPEEVQRRLAREAPAGLELFEVRRIPPKTTAHVRRVTYRIPLQIADCRLQNSEFQSAICNLQSAIPALLASPEVWVERTHPQPRRLNIRPYLDAIRVLDDALEMDLWVTPTGSARPDELLKLLGLGELLAEGAVLERVRLELEDEMPGGTDVPPLTTRSETEITVVAASPGPAANERRPQPLLPGPMDY